MTASAQTKVALITGASAGIGKAFARAFAARGFDLMLVARRVNRLETLRNELTESHGIRAFAVVCDLGQLDAASRLEDELARLGVRPDVLVNNAGYSIARTYQATDWQDQLEFIRVLVTVPAGLCHAVLPGMIAKGWGRIINVSSITAFSPGAPGHTLYPAAKSFIVKMSQSLAAEVRHTGVHVTAVCPGQTASEFADANGTRSLVDRSGMWTQSAEAVVQTAIRANEAGREVIVPGWHNKLSVMAMKLLPDRLTAALIRPVARKFVLEESNRATPPSEGESP